VAARKTTGKQRGIDVPKRDPSDRSLLPEVVTAALRARLRGLADARARREGGGEGYRVTGSAGLWQGSDTQAVAAYLVTHGLVVAWCNGGNEGAGWYSSTEAAQMGFDHIRRQVQTGDTTELAHQQRLAGEIASSLAVWEVG
jgi:hypothetical protein